MTGGWLWLIVGLALGVAEMLTGTYFLIWPGLAAAAVGLALFAAPGLGLGGQVALFALLALGLTVAGRAVVMRRARPAAGGLNRRGDRLVGRMARVRGVVDGVVEVEVDGELWRGRSDARFAPGDAAEIAGLDGATLVLRRP